MSWFRMDKRLLPVKGMYFVLLAANGNLNPFLPVFVKQLGLSSTETGIIFGLLPFIAFLICPLIGALADKIRKHILTFTVCLLLSGVLHCLLLFVPSKTCDMENGGNHSLQFDQHFKDGGTLLDCKVDHLQNNLNDVYVNNSNCRSFADAMFAHRGNGNVDIAECQERCNDLTNDQLNLTNINQTLGQNEMDDLMVCFDKGSNCRVMLQNMLNENVHTEHAAYNVTSFNIVSMNALTETIRTSVCQHLCDNKTIFSSNNISTLNGQCVIRPSYDRTFWLTLVIFLFSYIAVSPVTSLMDALAYATLGSRRNEWGKQRLFGTLGCGMFAVTSSFVMDSLSKSRIGIDYSFSFYVYLALGFVTCIIVHFLDVKEDVQCSHMISHIKIVLKYPKIVLFLSVILCIGIMKSVITTFLFWYLQELGSTQSVLGLSILAQCIPEMVAFFGSGYVIEHIGHTKCLYIALFAYALRFFFYSYLVNPWYVLLIEPLHSVTFGLMFASATSYCNIIAPEGMSSTIQGLLGGLYYGFGRGIGNIITGRLYDRSTGLGPVWTFRFYGFFSLGICGIYMLANVCLVRFGYDHTSATDEFKEKEEDKVDTSEQLLKQVINSKHAEEYPSLTSNRDLPSVRKT